MKPAGPTIENPDAMRAADAYAQAAQGDLARALLWALEDLIACEERCAARIARAEASVSRGFIRAAVRDPES